MLSVCGVSSTLPNISLEDAWYKRVSGQTSRTASSTRVTPTPVNSAVSVGWIQETATNDIAARL